MPERWLPIAGCDELYEVSDAGRIRRSAAGRVLRLTPDRKGYLCASLALAPRRKKMVKIGRVVCTAFIGPPPSPSSQSNHKNGIKADNRLANLEWTSPSENLQHAYDTGLRVQVRGERHGRAKLTDDQVRHIRALRGKLTLDQLAAEYAVNRNTIYLIHANRIWTHL